MNHSFNVELAIKYGIEEAILIENFAFWIKKNAANNKNYINGEYWTYNSAKALEELFPYMNLKKVQRTLLRLEQLKIFKSGNFNKKTYDRTKWYCIIDPEIKSMYQLNYTVQDDEKALDKMSNEEKCDLTEKPWTKCPMDLNKMSNAFTQNVQPIPDINTDINHIKKATATDIDTVNKKEPVPSDQQDSSSFLYEFLNNYKLDAGTKENIKKHIKGLTEERFKLIYMEIAKRFKEGKINDFSAGIFTALKNNWDNEWNIKAENKSIVDTEKERKKIKGDYEYWLDYYKACGGVPEIIAQRFESDVQNIRNKNLIAEYKKKLLKAMRKEE